MSRIHIFDAHLETANTWLEQLTENLRLAPTEHPRALHALRAGLHAIRDRLPSSEVIDLGAQLPTLIRGIYYDGWKLDNDPTKIRDRAAMLARVQKELAPDPRLDPVEVLRAVIQLLIAHVSAGEIGHVMSTLPKPIASLWHELAGHALDTNGASQRRPSVHR
ncbi:MAG TPA: DUF2267 domain-containing protein [Kofleriaceae bacterium]|nr:DUF2267 domain-containing protein [Kofleriaceae bacterium]